MCFAGHCQCDHVTTTRLSRILPIVIWSPKAQRVYKGFKLNDMNIPLKSTVQISPAPREHAWVMHYKSCVDTNQQISWFQNMFSHVS